MTLFVKTWLFVCCLLLIQAADDSEEEDKCARCDPNAICEADQCKCLEGFTGNGMKCTKAVKQCVACSPNAKCVNGECRCNDDFVGNGTVCTKAGPCKVNPTGPSCLTAKGLKAVTAKTDCLQKCGENGRCFNGECQCKCGYKNDGNACVEDKEKECSRCPQLASCDNADDNCNCKQGFQNTGKCCLREGIDDYLSQNALKKLPDGESHLLEKDVRNQLEHQKKEHHSKVMHVTDGLPHAAIKPVSGDTLNPNPCPNVGDKLCDGSVVGEADDRDVEEAGAEEQREPDAEQNVKQTDETGVKSKDDVQSALVDDSPAEHEGGHWNGKKAAEDEGESSKEDGSEAPDPEKESNGGKVDGNGVISKQGDKPQAAPTTVNPTLLAEPKVPTSPSVDESKASDDAPQPTIITPKSATKKSKGSQSSPPKPSPTSPPPKKITSKKLPTPPVLTIPSGKPAGSYWVCKLHMPPATKTTPSTTITTTTCTPCVPCIIEPCHPCDCHAPGPTQIVRHPPIFLPTAAPPPRPPAPSTPPPSSPPPPSRKPARPCDTACTTPMCPKCPIKSSIANKVNKKKNKRGKESQNN